MPTSTFFRLHAQIPAMIVPAPGTKIFTMNSTKAEHRPNVGGSIQKPPAIVLLVLSLILSCCVLRACGCGRGVPPLWDFSG
ncbi:unnamed protein product [Ectocarpus sp. 6 AP-2014]